MTSIFRSSALRRILLGGLGVLIPSTALAADEVKWGVDGVTYKPKGGNFEVTLGGRLHLDALSYEEDGAQFNDLAVRRARLEVSGRIGDDVRFRVDREFAGQDGWRNVWVSYRPTDDIEIKGGNFIVPFAMEDLQSSNRTSLMERSLVTALTPGFGLGIGARISRRHWTLAGGYFGDALGRDEDGRANERGNGVAARVTAAPIDRRGNLVHLGAAVERRSFSDGDETSFQSNTGSPLAPRLIGTDRIAEPDELTNVGAEFAVARGPVLFQGQYVSTTLSRKVGPTLGFDGWYTQASWVVTGERYDYSRGAGMVSGVNLRRGRGAVEVVARYSRLDLDDADVARGDGSAITLGANWYLNENVRVMMNYTASKATDVTGLADRESELIAGRLQVSF
ncbi:OprO/OprP family phosphate-selective porin [Brevundimonas sp.]|uniref:OprO/OprP family phosphate-selective porin n=1 Tax=Brevundimonas sp. TaxID=1871086 RepID=UPI002730ACBF|nr:porin [Brevundimonas sp.]MDP1914104.1 porin [Brevundimonas sp.]